MTDYARHPEGLPTYYIIYRKGISRDLAISEPIEAKREQEALDTFVSRYPNYEVVAWHDNMHWPIYRVAPPEGYEATRTHLQELTID